MSIVCYVHPTIVVVELIEVACLIRASLPLQVGAVLDRVQWDWSAHSGKQILWAQGNECHVSSLLHSTAHISPDSPRGPRAPIRKHGVRQDIHVNLTALQVVLLIELTVVLWRCVPVGSLHKGIPQQHREAVMVQAPRAQPAVLKGVVRVVSYLRQD
jgi:hypothetical protein